MPNDWSPAERLEVLMESYGLDGEVLNGFCREKGVFRHHLQQWREAFEAGTSAVSPVNPSELREPKATTREKGLDESGGVVDAPKKYQVLWEEKDG